MTGKVGNTIFYRNRNSNNKEKQGARIYVAEPANPQTENQASQRMLMAPIVAFYKANKDLLNHSFIPAGSAGQNWQRFLKLALSSPDGVPYVAKNDKRAVPGRFVISEGGLVNVAVDSIENAGVLTTLSLGAGFAIGATTTLGAISEAIINNNAGFVQGDELLFVACSEAADGASFVYNKQYLVLDVNNTQVAQAFAVGGTTYYMYDHVVLAASGGSLLFFIPATLSSITTHVAAAVCHSRKDGETWQYANTMLAINDGALADYFSSGAYSRARKSYMPTAGNVTSDKLLQQAGAEVVFVQALLSMNLKDLCSEAKMLAATNATAVRWGNHAENVLCAQMSDGSVRVFTSGDADYANLSGTPQAKLAALNGTSTILVDFTVEGSLDTSSAEASWLADGYEVLVWNSSYGTL